MYLISFLLLVSYTTPVQDLIGDTPSQCVVEMSKVLDQPDDVGDDWRRLWSELLDRPLNEEAHKERKFSLILCLIIFFVIIMYSRGSSCTCSVARQPNLVFLILQMCHRQ